MGNNFNQAMSILSRKSAIDFPIHMGDRKAFDYVFQTYYAPLCHFCENLITDEAIAEDIVTEVFTNLWEKDTSFGSKPQVQSFLYLSVRNASINQINYKKRVTEKHDLLAAKPAEDNEDYLDAMIQSEVWGEIYRAIENLPSQCSKVISLSYLEGLSNQEIADQMDISLQTVKNYKQRGIQKLKDNLPENLFIMLMFYQHIK